MAVVIEGEDGIIEERGGGEEVSVAERMLEDSACASQFDVSDTEESVYSLQRFLLAVSSRPSNEGEAARFVLGPVWPCGVDDGRLVASSTRSNDIVLIPPNGMRPIATRTSSCSI